MGFFTFGLATGLGLSVGDEFFYSVYEAAKQAFEEGMFVSFCTDDPDAGRYLQIDVTLFVPEVTTADGNKVIEDSNIMWMKAVPSGGESNADPVLVDQILDLMEETDGCIVIDTDGSPVLDSNRAMKIIQSAARINEFENVIFPDPSH